MYFLVKFDFPIKENKFTIFNFHPVSEVRRWDKGRLYCHWAIYLLNKGGLPHEPIKKDLDEGIKS